MRVAIGEMRHLRTVNDVLRELSLRGLTAQPHVPALGVAAALPAVVGATRPVANRPLTRAALEDFIDVERPSFSVDGLYAGILATLRRDAPGALADAIALVIAEGNEHFETLSYIQEWLSGHAEDDYLIVTQQPEPGNRRSQGARSVNYRPRNVSAVPGAENASDRLPARPFTTYSPRICRKSTPFPIAPCVPRVVVAESTANCSVTFSDGPCARIAIAVGRPFASSVSEIRTLVA
jgi:hypothetical protein